MSRRGMLWTRLTLILLGVAVAACSPAAPAAAPAASKSAPTEATRGAPAAGTAVPATQAAAPTAALPPATVRITDLQITSGAGEYIAVEKGYFREEGIQPELVGMATTDLLPSLVSGQVDVVAGIIVGSALFNAFGRGISVKIVADHGANLPNASAGAVVIRKELADSGAYRGPTDLRGRKVALTTLGGAPDLVMDRYLRSGGLTIADVETVVMPFPDMLPALGNGAVDAAWSQEPFTTIGIERGILVRGPTGHDIYPGQQIGLLVFGERMLKDRPLAVRFLRAYVRGVRDYVRAMQERDPAAFEEVVPILIEHTTMKDRALFEKAIPSGLRPDPLPNAQSIADDQEWYLAHGHQTQRINVQDFVDTSYVEQAIRELGSAGR
jgi:NitT/TauT family transport system substrate-binding protein